MDASTLSKDMSTAIIRDALLKQAASDRPGSGIRNVKVTFAANEAPPAPDNPLLHPYSEALERQIRVHQWLSTPAAAAQLAGMTGFGWSPATVQIVREGLAVATPYYFSPRMAPFLRTAADSFPRETVLRPEMLPSPSGFCYFPPASLGVRTTVAEGVDSDWIDYTTNSDGTVTGTVEGLEIRGVSWTTCRSSDPKYRGASVVQASLWFVNTRAVNTPDVFIPILSAYWGLGSSLGDTLLLLKEEEIVDAEIGGWRAVLSVFGSLISLMSQRLLVTSRERVPRGTYRRAQRELVNVQEPLVNVVELRRREYKKNPDVESREVAWSCQWVVGWHWHKYHTKWGIVSRYLAPYVKGPADMPLKTPTTKLFAVVR